MNKDASPFAVGCATLILLPFATVGLGAAIFSYYSLVQWFIVTGYTETPATIVSIELDESVSRGKNGGRSITYETQAKYNYEVDGKTYSSESVSWWGGHDNIGYQSGIYRSLRSQLNQPDAVSCYVNPRDPTDAALRRDPRSEIFAFMTLFAGCFGMFGILPLSGLVYSLVTGRDPSVAGAIDQPHNDSFTHSWTQIRSQQYTQAKSGLVAGYWWLLGALPTVIVGIAELLTRPLIAGLSLLIPMVAAALFYRWLSRWQGGQRDGYATLEIQTHPVPLGTTLQAHIVVPEQWHPEGPVRWKLFCEQVSGTKKRRTYKKLWNADGELCDPEHAGDALRYTLNLHLPESEEPTSSRKQITWKLGCSVPVSGPDRNIQFPIHVINSHH